MQCQKNDSSYSETKGQYVREQDSKKHKIMDADHICRSQGFILPEIRTVNDKEAVRKVGIVAGITIIRAGVYFRTEGSNFRFMSRLIKLAVSVR
jgi:hypothetical protein